MVHLRQAVYNSGLNVDRIT